MRSTLPCATLAAFALAACVNGSDSSATVAEVGDGGVDLPSVEVEIEEAAEGAATSGAATPGVVGFDPAAFVKPSEDELRARLTPLQYRVTQEDGTERARTGAWDGFKGVGIYVDVVSGEPLFSSLDKFDSGTGWPSFVRPIEEEFVVEKEDRSLFSVRTEIRSRYADSHLGHVFPDGPRDRGGMRYCMNAVAMDFVPVADLAGRGYGEYLARFEQAGIELPEGSEMTADMTDRTETAILAGGCFWGMEDLLRKIDGVLETEVGYCGGENANATYRNHPGHAEAVRIVFDPEVISLRKLLVDWFFRMHDPTTLDRQGNDRGSSYRSTIFYFDERQKRIGEEAIAEIEASDRWKDPVVTTLEPVSNWSVGEEEHQDYLLKKPNGYTCHFLRPWEEGVTNSR